MEGAGKEMSRCNHYPRPEGQRHCLGCHAASIRSNVLLSETRVRRATRHAVEQGVLIRKPCRSCGDPSSETHHPDYAQPLKVQWLCKPCHLAWHRKHKALRYSAVRAKREARRTLSAALVSPYHVRHMKLSPDCYIPRCYR